MASSRPPYIGHLPGTPGWMEVWRMYPSWQEEMLGYQSLLEMGINPVRTIDGCEPDKVFRVSNSSLTATSCSVKALLRYGYRVVNPDKLWSISVGAAIHKSMAVYFRTGDPKLAYDKLIDCYPEGNPPEERLHLDNVKAIMHHYLFETLKAFPYFVHPSLVELWFEQELYRDDDGSIVLVGRIDLLPEDERSKALMVLDHKSTGKITDWWQKGFLMDSGLNGYLWAAQRFMPGRLFPGCVINAIELCRLPIPGRKCKVHGLDYAECRKFHPNHKTFSANGEPRMIEEWWRGAVYQAKRLRTLLTSYAGDVEGIKYVRMLGKFNGMCTFCEYLDFCLAGRPVEWIGTVLVKREDIEGLEG
jgi:hypothetical protein